MLTEGIFSKVEDTVSFWCRRCLTILPLHTLQHTLQQRAEAKASILMYCRRPPGFPASFIPVSFPQLQLSNQIPHLKETGVPLEPAMHRYLLPWPRSTEEIPCGMAHVGPTISRAVTLNVTKNENQTRVFREIQHSHQVTYFRISNIVRRVKLSLQSSTNFCRQLNQSPWLINAHCIPPWMP